MNKVSLLHSARDRANRSRWIPSFKRRKFTLCGLLLKAGVTRLPSQNSPDDEQGYRPLFDGSILKGWRLHAQSQVRRSPGNCVTVDVIVGGQDLAGTGSYLVSDEAFDDIELVSRRGQRLRLPKFEPKAMLERSERSGHIALEVHDDDVRMGTRHLGAPGAVRPMAQCLCRDPVVGETELTSWRLRKEPRYVHTSR
jgi:hypothetical protein